MKTSYKWIKDLVPGLDEIKVEDFGDAMTMSGSKVETIEHMDKNLENIVIGKVVKLDPHPDADKLRICQVDVGTGETIQIVTGAPNVKEGKKYPAVLVGGNVASSHGEGGENGIKIKKGKLRGIESFGMLCSIDELGSDCNMYPDADPDGLYELPDDAPVGADAVAYLGLDDAVIEYEITSNRVDCFAVLGLAREAAATFKKDFKIAPIKETGKDGDVNDYIKVSINDTDLCSRYCARVVKNIKIEPSPWWMQRRLAAQGIRPINNIVDITNYVMEEYGQPMHAYDLDKIGGKEIIVKRAAKGDKFVTLDKQERILDDTVLMINDANGPVGIAGIMGGENSMITDDVKTMLFEAACFDGANIRVSAKKIGMRTDASSKFEKGLDPENALAAINRACELIEELGAGEVVKGVVDVYPVKKAPVKLPFEPEKYNKLLGTNVSAEEMLTYFARLEIGYDKASNELLIPSFRQDLLCDADIAEEVARFFGYDKIPTSLPGGVTAGGLNFKQRIEGVARDAAENAGFSQGYVYSFESPKVFDKLNLPADAKEREAIVIMNPLGEDYSIMRTTSLNGMLTSLSTNFNRRNKSVRLYEMGNIYLPKALPLTELPEERMMLTFGFYGDGDFFDMKGAVESFFDKAGIDRKLTYNPTGERPYLHPGRQADIYAKDVFLGYIGEVHPTVCANYGIKDRAYVAVIDMANVTELASFNYKYTPLAKFPAVTRDLSIIMPKSILAQDIEAIFDKKGGAYLESYELFDVFEGGQIAVGFKSLAYSLSFRAPDKTLDDETVNQAIERILKGIEGLGASLRS